MMSRIPYIILFKQKTGGSKANAVRIDAVETDDGYDVLATRAEFQDAASGRNRHCIPA